MYVLHIGKNTALSLFLNEGRIRDIGLKGIAGGFERCAGILVEIINVYFHI